MFISGRKKAPYEYVLAFATKKHPPHFWGASNYYICTLLTHHLSSDIKITAFTIFTKAEADRLRIFPKIVCTAVSPKGQPISVAT